MSFLDRDAGKSFQARTLSAARRIASPPPNPGAEIDGVALHTSYPII
jgi:hypothetical protein